MNKISCTIYLLLLTSACSPTNPFNPLPDDLAVDAALPAARVGQPYNAKFDITGGTPPYTFIDYYGFPAKITFDNTTGQLSGTPVIPSTNQIYIKVQDSGTPPQTVEQTTTLVIKPLGVSIVTDSLDNGTLLNSYNQKLQAENGTAPYNWKIGPAVGSLPEGLVLDKNNGTIKGIPTKKETQTFTITVTDSDANPTSASKQFTIIIQ